MRLPATRTLLPAILFTALAACSDSSDDNPAPPEPPEPPEPTITYDAEIVWTTFGIPTVLADDWGSLGYGYGYAYAQENFCVAMKEFVRAAGESSRYLGEEGDLSADLVYKLVNDEATMQRIFFDAMPQHVLDVTAGYTAGLNRYLDETGVDNLAEGEEGCRGAEWVRPVESIDVARLMHKAVLVGSSGPLADFTVAAAAPPDTVAAVAPARADFGDSLQRTLATGALDAALDLPEPSAIGSNAYAVGEQASQSDAGVLLGNPHFPWQGPQRWFMSHLQIPGEYDVMGATLHGLPVLTIGFNQNVAWTHTVSTGSRFTFYELTLNPDDPMQYIFDGEIMDLTSQTVSAEVLDESGAVSTVEHTFYLSHFGPIVDLGTVSPLLGGWPNAAGTLLTYRDANLENLRGIPQWIEMGQAEDLGALKTALASIGIPWVNTIAADRYGDAFYGDISANPHVSSAQYEQCIRGTLQTLLTQFGFLTMDGADPDCEWGEGSEPAPGLFTYEELPKLETREYGANANDSYWLPNPRQLLEGFSPVIGAERVPQSLRTRATFAQAEERIAGTDGLGDPGFNVDNVREMLFGARNYTAELVRDDVVSQCEGVDFAPYTGNSDAASQACEVLADWDTRHSIDSLGAHVFYEFWQVMRGTENLWAVPFDPADPVNTPSQLNVTDDAVAEAVRTSLAAAVDRLIEAGIPMDAPWGEVQFDEKNGVRYPIHGGSSSMMFSVITSPLVDGEGYSAIRHGNSYMQAVTWDSSDCPVAFASLSYSQSTDPASDHYADLTEAYSNGEWIDMPYCEADRDAEEVRRETVQE